YCPAHVDIPNYIALIGEHRYADAINCIRLDNPFPTACAFICEHPCEEKCRRDLLDSPVNIRGLKKFAVDQVPADAVKVPECNVTTGKTVAVIGGGPSGLTAAYYLSLMGHRVVVFEERSGLGGMLRYGIPGYRLPKDRLDQDINAILSTGNIEVRNNVRIPDDVAMEDINKEFDAIYISIGAQLGRTVDVEGAQADGVYSAVEMLSEIGRGNLPDYTDKRVVVVGGGNVAMDASRSAIRCNAKEVTVIYRRRQVDMTALPSEIQGAIEEGVELLTLNAPDSVETDEDNRVTGLKMQPQITSVHRGGKPTVKAANTDKRVHPCDIVLMAVGQDIDSAPFSEYDVNPKKKTFNTTDTARLKSYEKIFAGGDCVFGPSTVIKAIGAGKVAAVNIDEYLGYHHKIPDTIEYPEPKDNDRTHIGRVHLTDKSARERKKSFEPVENGMSFDEAMQECGKCLRCDHFGCGVLEGGRV
ncbi:MAG: FAD-dependent oxidoreductase, partial [Lachnospiraceae bacterium]|nr:FAD-dependent oxidoreductase [Lachnospiraceae bacterium]